MNAAQKKYMVAKAAFVASAEAKAEKLAPFAHLLDTDAGIEQYTDLEIKFNNELNCDKYRKALRTAEDNMVKWANAKVSKSKHFTAKAQQTMNEVMAAYPTNVSVRNRMIEAAFLLK